MKSKITLALRSIRDTGHPGTENIEVLAAINDIYGET